MNDLKIFASCPVYLEDLLEEEILTSGGKVLKKGPGGHLFSAGLRDVYHFILWSRIASRVLLYIKDFPCQGGDDVYNASRSVPWETLMDGESSIACSCTTSSRTLLPPGPGTLKVKDGLVDYWRDLTGSRPDVDRDNPDISVHLHIQGEDGTLYLDLSGEGLHKRGYRLDAGKAGLRENTAAAILLRSGWQRIAASGGSLVDPMCGSGTLLIEAAYIAADLPPGLNRYGYGFFNWKGHEPDLWESVFDEAETKVEEHKKNLPMIIGYDNDKRALEASRENIKRAGLEGLIHLERKELEDFSLTEKMKKSPGLIVTNPPYGQRLGEKGMLFSLYRTLGDLGRSPDMKNWKMSVISDDESLLGSIGLKADRKNRIMNGPIKCSLYHYSLFGLSSEDKERKEKEISPERRTVPEDLSPEAEQFLNRLKKNLKQLGKWSRKNDITCFRLYDADLPNFNFAIDFYEKKWVHLQEYAPPKGVDPDKAFSRLRTAVKILSGLLDIPPSSVFTKQRRRQKGPDQYKTLQRAGERYLMNEWDCRFWVNFTDYLDTGIFLDHRNVRKYIKENSKGKKVLNLFCYTGTASVMAAAGGALQVCSVDTSATYLKWAKDNFQLNRLNPEEHRFIKEDVSVWLRSCKDRFDLIFMDPPTFSNSKSRMDVLDIQEDHTRLIRQAVGCLNPGGLLIFSNNYKRFVLDEAIEHDFRVTEETSWTGSPDFSRKGASHRSWFVAP